MIVTPRTIISYHAVLSSILEQIISESQNEIVLNQHLSFCQETVAFSSLVFASWLSYQYLHTDKFAKLEFIQDYKESKKTVRTVISIFVFIFLRNVENAI